MRRCTTTTQALLLLTAPLATESWVFRAPSGGAFQRPPSALWSTTAGSSSTTGASPWATMQQSATNPALFGAPMGSDASTAAAAAAAAASSSSVSAAAPGSASAESPSSPPSKTTRRRKVKAPQQESVASATSSAKSGSRKSSSSSGSSSSSSGGRSKPKEQQQPRSLKHMASESVAWTLKRMAESPLLTAQQELILGRHTQRLGAFEAERAVLKTVLDREPTMGEWAAACNYTATAFAAKQQQNVLKAQRAAAAAAAAAAENNEEPLPAPPVPPPREMTDALALKAFDSDLAKGRRAKEQLVNSNMRLVVSIARRYQSLGVGLQDLIQEGSLGLIRAAEKYDPSRGFRFSTYASWWIQQAVFRAVAFQSRIIRLPMHIHNLLNRVRNTRKDMFMETGVIPTDAELAGRLGVSIDKLRLVLNSSRRTYSSSAPLKVRRRRGSGASGEGEMSFEDSTQSSTGSGARSDDMLPEEFVEGLLFRSEIHDVLDVLDDDERFVVTLRYGLGVPRRLSMSEIAEMAGTGKVWVKKMEQRALRKLRRPHHQMKLRPFSIDKQQLDGASDDLSRTMAYRKKWEESPPEEFLSLQQKQEGEEEELSSSEEVVASSSSSSSSSSSEL